MRWFPAAKTEVQWPNHLKWCCLSFGLIKLELIFNLLLFTYLPLFIVFMYSFYLFIVIFIQGEAKLNFSLPCIMTIKIIMVRNCNASHVNSNSGIDVSAWICCDRVENHFFTTYKLMIADIQWCVLKIKIHAQ